MLLDRIIRAWKDPEYRLSLSDEDQALLPENPAGAIELSDDELEMAAGGHGPSHSYSRSYSASSNSSNRSSNSSNRSSRRSSDKSSRRSYRRSYSSRRSSGSWRRRHW
jgi:mersacidin/lichenicidin family type 2 lantibiotic